MTIGRHKETTKKHHAFSAWRIAIHPEQRTTHEGGITRGKIRGITQNRLVFEFVQLFIVRTANG